MRALGQFGLGFGLTLVVGLSGALWVATVQAHDAPSRSRRGNPPVSACESHESSSPGDAVRANDLRAPDDTMPAAEPGIREAATENGPSVLQSAIERLSRVQSCYGFWTDQTEYDVYVEHALQDGSPQLGELELNEDALTALCLLCLVESGQSHLGAERDNSCRIALTYLLSRQNGSGFYAATIDANRISTQALALWALQRLYRATDDRSIELPLNAAATAATAMLGQAGWPRDFRDRSRVDPVTTAWMLSALQDSVEVGEQPANPDWQSRCLEMLEDAAKREQSPSVLNRAMYLASAARAGSIRENKHRQKFEEDLLLRANDAELNDMHEVYWIASALELLRSEGIWRDAIRAKAEEAVQDASLRERGEWHGGKVYRLALGIRTLQTLQ